MADKGWFRISSSVYKYQVKAILLHQFRATIGSVHFQMIYPANHDFFFTRFKDFTIVFFFGLSRLQIVYTSGPITPCCLPDLDSSDFNLLSIHHKHHPRHVPIFTLCFCYITNLGGCTRKNPKNPTCWFVALLSTSLLACQGFIGIQSTPQYCVSIYTMHAIDLHIEMIHISINQCCCICLFILHLFIYYRFCSFNKQRTIQNSTIRYIIKTKNKKGDFQ